MAVGGAELQVLCLLGPEPDLKANWRRLQSMAKTPRILFVSAGNSARGQMAEGFARYYAGGRLSAHSAGTDPTEVSPYALWVMNEAAVDIKQQSAEPLSAKNLEEFDRIVVIYDPSRESAPELSGSSPSHWPLTDPAGLRGPPSQIRDSFRFSRNEIERRVKSLLQDVLGAPMTAAASA
ncbi:MAG: arsenate reductase ArsC [Acidobacteriota bacterium]